MVELQKTHAHAGYDKLFHGVIDDLQTMTDTVDQMLEMLIEAIEGNEVTSREAKIIDKEINALELSITANLHSVLTKYSPAMDELRFLIAMIQVAGRMERMGDMIKTNIRRLSKIVGEEGEALPTLIQKPCLSMLGTIREMLAASMRNISAFDESRLSRILEREESVNDEYVNTIEALQEELPKAIRKNTLYYNTLLMLLKDIERCADQGFEIGRVAYYAHTGDRPKKKEIRNG